MSSCPDQHIRDCALDPRQSFIVQAPAGSGKTELLVRRFLVLLAQAVQTPEEILAITFTRKAAAEMRQRILEALQLAAMPPPETAHQYQTWEIAQAALAKDRQYQWNLLDNPQRLRVQTIDGFCHYLTRSMFLTSGLGNSVSITEHADEYYIQAVKRLFLTLEEDSLPAEALAQLLLHLDNRVELLEELFIQMLKQRDQWLPHLIAHRQVVAPAEFRDILERSLSQIVQQTLRHCRSKIPVHCHAELLSLFNFSTANLRVAQSKMPIANCEELITLPGSEPNQLPIWQAFVDFLLTKDKVTEKRKWRSKVDVKLGFPAEHKAMKVRMEALLAELQGHESLLSALQQVSICPPPTYSPAQWQILQAIAELLPLLVAELKLIFKEHNTADFSEVAQAALLALEDFESPTELALILDQHISHILVDEFQDTANNQFRLLEKLTVGWQPDDGRSLFLVGDPMQSIYRFREAEVGLFLKAQQEGIGDIKLQALCLSANFRSTPAVVDWINQHFQHLFPKHSDINSGAVPFAPAVAMQTHASESNVCLYPLDAETEDLSARVIEIIQQLQKENPQQSIAILLRARTHVLQIIPNLHAAGLPFNAVEIASLAEQPVIYDLLALTSALLNPGDRLSWLAVLRAPWCGLILSDLHAVTGHHLNAAVWDLLQNIEQESSISADGKHRLRCVIPIFAAALAQRGRVALRPWIERTWQALNGPACLRDTAELAAAEAYFELLEEYDADGSIPDMESLEQQLQRSHVNSKAQEDCRLSIMTIHKAKGLEFDAVIIPHLQKSIGRTDEKLLLWLEQPQSGQENALILAPIKPRHADADPIYRYLSQVEKCKSAYELTRLLYVAATRAKNSLHLLAEVKKSAKPNKNSFLSLLWPAFPPSLTPSSPQETQKKDRQAGEVLLARLKSERLATLPSSIKPKEETLVKKPYSPALFDYNRSLGIVIHRCLQTMAEQGMQPWSAEHVLAQQKRWQMQLLQTGVIPGHMDAAIDIITVAIMRTLQDPRAQWLFKNHANAQNEYAITAVVDEDIHSWVIDRTFVDADNQRWIIDYKTTDLHGENPESVLDRAQTMHRQQLENYAQALQHLDTRPIFLGLYFPLFSGWRQWQFSSKIPLSRERERGCGV